MYAIIDVETTGGSPKRERIIEIAIVKSNGEKIIDTYETLVNPEKMIPPFVSKLTGISNDMVEQAPVFEEVAAKINAFTKGCVIVAHNAHFDYGFIKSEFRYIGEYYQRDRICTVKLTQRALPGLEGYSLSKLTEHFNIEHSGKHRAYADAEATTELLHILLREANPQILAQFMHKGYFNHPPEILIPEKHIADVPEETGTLTFHNNDGKILFVMKSADLYTRITDMLFYFNPETHKGNMLKKATDISYTITGSEILAQILEIELIYKHKPSYNKKTYGLSLVQMQTNKDQYGYYNIQLSRSKKIDKNGTYFSNFYEANSQIGSLVKLHKLCPILCTRETNSNGSCAYFEKNLCQGACMKKEEQIIYNKRVLRAIKKLRYKTPNFLLIDEGPDISSKTVFVIKNNTCTSYAIMDRNIPVDKPDNIPVDLKPIVRHPVIDQKIRMYIQKNKHEEIIPY